MSKLVNFIKGRWKAIMPLVVFGVAYAIQHGFDVRTLASVTGLKAFIGSVIAAILVHSVPNVGASAIPAPAPPGPPA